jgi:predicted transcriptional regulator
MWVSELMSKVGLPGGEMGKPREITAREHFVQLRISRELKRRVLSLAEEYDRTVSDVLRGALRFGVPVMEGLQSIEREFVRSYLKQLKDEISKSQHQIESKT